jgi:hypothetical protein
MVDYRDSAILRMLVLEKLDANRLAGRNANGMKGPALSTMASSGGVKADAGEEKPHRPIGPHTGGGKRDQSGMERTPTVAGAKFTGGGHARFGRSRSPILRVLVNPNAHRMQARKTAGKSAIFLTCIVGGKA